MKIDFFCDCVPPKATAQQKGACVVWRAAGAGARAVRAGDRLPVHGASVRVYTKRRVADTKRMFAALFAGRRPPRPLDGPLRVCVTFTFPWRKGEGRAARAKGWAPMPVRPDFDNLAKTVFDVMGGLSFWSDDGQVYDGRVVKGWGDRPGVRVEIEEVEGWGVKE